MLTIDSNLRIPPFVTFTFVDGDAVLLNTRTNQYFALAEVGARFWNLFKEGRSLREVCLALLEEYEAPPAQLERDILELVGRLMENGLVELAPA